MVAATASSYASTVRGNQTMMMPATQQASGVSNYYVLKTPETVPVMVVAKLDPAAILPSKATPSAAGFDLHAPYDLSIPGWSVRTISTGIRVTPPGGHYIMITGRSGLSQQGILTISGTVDPDYTGDVGVMLFNTQPQPYEVLRDQRIAQMIPIRAAIDCTSVVMNQSDLVIQDHLARAAGGRGARGFGSSGF